MSLADKILIVRGVLGRVRAAGTSQGPDSHLDEMTEGSQTELQEIAYYMEFIQRKIDTIITREQARGSNYHVYNAAITAAQPGYRENHTNQLTPVVDSMVDRINNSDSGSVPPDQHPTTNWTRYNEENSKRIEWPPVSGEPSRSTRRGSRGGAHKVRYCFQCTVPGCNSKPLRYRSKLRYVSLLCSPRCRETVGLIRASSDHHSVHNSGGFSCPLCPTFKAFKQFRSLVRHKKENHESRVGLPQVDGNSADDELPATPSLPRQGLPPVPSHQATDPAHRPPQADHDEVMSGEASESADGFFAEEVSVPLVSS